MDEGIELSVLNAERELAGNADLDIGIGTEIWKILDGGVQTWTFILCTFVLEILLWGFPLRWVSPRISGR